MFSKFLKLPIVERSDGRFSKFLKLPIIEKKGQTFSEFIKPLRTENSCETFFKFLILSIIEKTDELRTTESYLFSLSVRRPI